MPLLFATSLFVSAALLFWVQPLIGKLLLPLLGGTPAVWTTCMLFFQGALLAGYAYALALTRRLSVRGQAALHLSLLAAAAVVSLPFGVSGEAAGPVPARTDPTLWLLATLAASVGLPFLALSASAPLFQKWFSETRHRSAPDPYFLYAASNAGSLFALLAFPVLFEPFWTLDEQRRAWAAGYLLLVALTAACAFAAWRHAATRTAGVEAEAGPTAAATRDGADGPGGPVTWRRRLLWVALSFVPSSLVLGVTTYITTDVAAVPLLWVVPLALYLLTFILAFARGRRPLRRATALILPGAGIVLTLVYLSGATEPAWFLVTVHLAFFFIAAFVCHARLADDRPAARDLAEFFLWVAVGGVLGGVFNALVAPVAFDRVVEYPLAILLACLLRAPLAGAKSDDARASDESRGGRILRGLGLGLRKPQAEARLSDAWLPREDATPGSAEAAEATRGAAEGAGATAGAAGDAGERRARVLDLALPAAVGVGVAVLTMAAARLDIEGVERLALTLGLPLIVVNHFFTRRPARFALALGAVMLASVLYGEAGAHTLHSERNFFGTLRVSYDPSNDTRRLSHGSTIHGRQFASGARRCEPLSYYHRLGPLGSVFEAARSVEAPSRVAAVGLGTGTIAAYARPGERWTFYEINPAVLRLARDPRYFSYLDGCAPGAEVEVVLGDARLRMRDAPDGAFDLIVLDAFSSDAIPASLLTREALALYLSKLAPGGLVVFHVSNRGLELGAVVGGLAREAGLSAVVLEDAEYLPDIGKEPSEWVAVARRPEDLAPLSPDPRWRPLEERPGRPFVVWTDDFSDIIGVLKLK